MGLKSHMVLTHRLILFHLSDMWQVANHFAFKLEEVLDILVLVISMYPVETKNKLVIFSK